MALYVKIDLATAALSKLRKDLERAPSLPTTARDTVLLQAIYDLTSLCDVNVATGPEMLAMIEAAIASKPAQTS